MMELVARPDLAKCGTAHATQDNCAVKEFFEDEDGLFLQGT